MQRNELLTLVQDKLAAKDVKINKEDLNKVFCAVFEVVGETALAGTPVSTPVGRFKARVSAERAGRNPKTGEAITVKGRTRLAFTAAPAYSVVNE